MPDVHELVHRINDLAQEHRWKVFHTWSPNSCGGFPNLCLVRGSRIIFATHSPAREEVEGERREWLKTLDYTGKCEVYMWSLPYWDDIVDILTAPDDDE